MDVHVIHIVGLAWGNNHTWMRDIDIELSFFQGICFLGGVEGFFFQSWVG
jgi:hypothetical protein